MKQILRTLAAFMCLVLALSSFPCVFAEEIIEEESLPMMEIIAEDPVAVESVFPDADMPESDQAPEAEATVAPEATQEPDVSAEPEATQEPEVSADPEATQEPEPEDEAAPALSAADLPGFREGYARLLTAAMGYSSASPNAPAMVYLESGVIYASNRRASSANDRIEARFDGGEDEICVWIDALYLSPLDETEASSFALNRSSAENVRFYNEHPLDAPVYSSAITVESEAPNYNASVPAMLLSQSEITLGVGESAELKAEFSDGKRYKLNYASADPSIAAVSPKGKLSAKAVGSVGIRITSELGNEAIVQVHVLPAPTAVSVTADKKTIGVKETLQLVPSITTEGAEGKLKFSSSNKKYVKVDQNGLVTGVRAGSAKITVSTYNGKKASIKITVKKAPSKVILSAERTQLGLGENLQLSYKLTKGSAGSVTLTSSKPEVLSVSETGEITALALGSAEITARTHNGKKHALSFEVKNAPTAVLPAAESITISENDSSILAYSLPDGCAGSVSFASSDPQIASVDETGRIYAHKQGTAEITLTAYGGANARCALNVLPAPGSITLSAGKTTIGVKETLQLSSVLSPEGATSTLKFSSSNKKYVKVDQNGLVTGVRAGSAKITVSTYNGKKASIKITVKKAPSKVILSAERTQLGLGEGLQLGYKLTKGSIGSVTFTSSNPDVLSVSENAYITALAVGSAEITAKTHNGKKHTIRFEVKAAPSEIRFADASLTLGTGEKGIVSAILTPGSAGSVIFSSEDPSIATIDPESGEVKALKAGATTLYARSYNGPEASCTLQVKNAPTGVAFPEKSITIAKGDKVYLPKPVISGEDAYSAGLKYSSSNKKIATVSAAGLVTGVRTGSTKITVSTYNGKKASIKITIKSAPKSISFDRSEIRLFVGGEYIPQISFANKVEGSYTLSSSNPAVAEIRGGVVRALSGGTATITATSFNKKTAVLKVTVPALPQSIEIQPATYTMGMGDSVKFSVHMPDGQDSALKFESSNPEIASVDAEGRVSAIAPGSAVIRVTTLNDLIAESRVTVAQAPTAIRLSPNRAQHSIDEGSLQLEVDFGSAEEHGRVSYSSSDTAVAKVSSGGKVSFVGIGTVQITASTYNGLSAVCDLTIGEQPGKIAFAATEYKIALGDSIAVPVEFDRGCESYSLSIADSDIAQASGNRVKGLQLGSTTLTATSRSGFTAECTLTIVDTPSGITLSHSEAELTMGLNSTLQLSASVQPDGVGSVVYTSSNPVVAIVDYHSGLVTAKDSGECIITAATYDGAHSVQCRLTVKKLLEGVKIGIDPGHQLVADRSMEAIAPGSRTKRHKVASGTRGKATGVREHVVNLQIGLKLRDALESLGAEVYMTRETADVNISNQQRAKMMNELGVDLVLRVHCNASSSSSTKGMSIYVRKTGTKKAESKAAAKLILKYMAAETGAKNLGVKYSDSYTGLNWSTVPSMLMELGYMTNRTEDKKLNDPAYQDKLVIGMINGICEYMGREIPYK